MIAARPLYLVLLLAAGLASAATAQEQPGADSRIEASQIAAPLSEGEQRDQPSKAFLDNAPVQPPAPRASLMQTPGEQLARASGSAPASQITNAVQGGSAVAQLSKAELEATLAQLSAAERRVLLQAIEGSDICDNPPAVAAVVALCQSRLETRSQEFATPSERALSAEERLMRGDVDNTGLPSVVQVIERLSRVTVASDDFSNQAIASIALAPPSSPEPGAAEDDGTDPLGLSSQTQDLVNAIVNQLGGRAGGGP